MLKVDISGLDELQKTLKEASQALGSLDGEFARIRLDGADPLEVQRAIHKMETAVDAKIEPYRSTPILARLADVSKETFRKKILDLAGSLRNPESKLTFQQLQSEKGGMNPSFDLKRKQRFEYMNELYRATDGSETAHVDMANIGVAVGLSRDECLLTVQYLNGEGLLQYVGLDGWIGIVTLPPQNVSLSQLL